MKDFDELLKEYVENDKLKIAMMENQLKKGCKNCSQWDDCWGCDKCES